MTRCLVTGGAGFIGSHLTARLLADGHDVIVLDNLSTGRSGNLGALSEHPRFHFVQGSITDPIAVAGAVRGVDVIYHLAAAVGVRLVADDPVRTIETNIYPTDQLLRLAAHNQTPFFLASTSEVFGKNPKDRWNEEDDLHFGPTSRPRWAYGVSKAIDEFLALAYHQQFGLPVVIGRFFNVVGPRQVGEYGMVIPRFVERAITGAPLVVYDDGGQERCFAHVSDVIECIVRLMNTPEATGKLFNIGGDTPISIRALAELIIRLTDSRSTIIHEPYDVAYGERFEDIRRRVPDISRLDQTIGFKPNMAFESILMDIIESMRSDPRFADGLAQQ